MQEMSYTGFGLAILMIVGLAIYLLFSIENNITLRNQNDANINNAKNCIELQTFYQQSLSFENGFSSNNLNILKITAEEQTKAKELGCN